MFGKKITETVSISLNSSSCMLSLPFFPCYEISMNPDLLSICIYPRLSPLYLFVAAPAPAAVVTLRLSPLPSYFPLHTLDSTLLRRDESSLLSPLSLCSVLNYLPISPH